MAGALTRLRRRPSPWHPSSGFWFMGEVLGMCVALGIFVLLTVTVNLFLKLFCQ